MVPENGLEFEEYVAQHLRQAGYVAQTTAASHDFGADIVAIDPNTNRRICVQTKFHGRPIGNSAIQEVAASLAHYSADEGWVVTNSTFTDSAQTLARENGIRLIDGQKLNHLVKDVQSTATNNPYHRNTSANPAAFDPDTIFYAARIIVERQRVSASELKARLHISNEQALALIDTLEEHGIVSPAIKGTRAVLIDERELEAPGFFEEIDGRSQKDCAKKAEGGLFHRILSFLKM